jgi:transposase-like protein
MKQNSWVRLLTSNAGLSAVLQTTKPVTNVLFRRAYLRAVAASRPESYLNNVLEQDHRFIKKRIAARLWFRSVRGALNTIAGYESMHMIRKGQIRWLEKGDVIGQIRFIHQIYGIAA